MRDGSAVLAPIAALGSAGLSRVSQQVKSLMKATVLMRQPGRVQEIVGALRRGGGDRLQVPGRGARPGRVAEGCLSCGLPATAGEHAVILRPGVDMDKLARLGGREPICPNSQLLK